MQEPLPDLRRIAAFDWKDLLLVAAGWQVIIAVLSALPPLTGRSGKSAVQLAVLVGVVAPLVARRWIFGVPALGEPKTGIGWSMLSMLGILAALGGMGVAAIGAYPLWDGGEARLGLVSGGLGAVVFGAVATALRYKPRSALPGIRPVDL